MRAATMPRPPAGMQTVSRENSARNSLWGAVAVGTVAAVFHIGVVMVVHWKTGGQRLFPDARGYDSVSDTIAAAWRSGNPVRTGDLARVVGSAVWGYPAVMALCKIMTGGGWLAAKTVLGLLASTGALAAYGLAITSGRGPRRATVIGLLVGTSPSLLLWDAWGLKDGLVTSLILWALLIQTRARFSLACVGTLLGVYACLYLRPAAALFLAVALLARMRLRSQNLVGALIVAGASACFLLPRLTTLSGLVDNLEVTAGTQLGFNGGYGSQNLVSHPQYLVTFLLGPFPWEFGPGTAVPQRWLYLGTVIWIACLALAPAALRKAWADTTGVGRSAVLASCAYFATYLVTFGAAFYRQRSVLECMLLIIVALYLPLAPAAAMTRIHIWLACIAGVAAVYSRDLTPTVWSKGLAAFGICMAVLLAVTWNPLQGWARRLRPRRT